MNTNEVLKLALEALEYIEHNYMSLPAPAEKAITALREALAEQPAQQEPVAWLVECGGDSALVRHTENFPGIFAGNEFNKRPLVFGDKSPPVQRTWVGLTDEEVQAAVYDENGCVVDYENYAEAIEAKLKEKNT